MPQFCDRSFSPFWLIMQKTEHVSGAWSADLPLSAQAYFCDNGSALLGLPLRASLPLKRFLECPLTAPLPLARFSARSAPFSALLTLRAHALADKHTDDRCIVISSLHTWEYLTFCLRTVQKQLKVKMQIFIVWAVSSQQYWPASVVVACCPRNTTSSFDFLSAWFLRNAALCFLSTSDVQNVVQVIGGVRSCVSPVVYKHVWLILTPK